MQPALNCSFCNLSDREQSLIHRPGVLAVPSFGAYVEGWTLVVPEEHVQAIAALDLQSRAAFDEAVDEVRQRVNSVYGPSISFEHGAIGAGRHAGCGVDHAHLHVVPLQLDIRTAITALEPELGSFSWAPCDQLPAYGVKSDYVWISDNTGSWIALADMLPSQLVRRAIAQQLGIATWDWKQDHRMGNVEATFSRLSGRRLEPVPTR